jgi:hypothetical protein
VHSVLNSKIYQPINKHAINTLPFIYDEQRSRYEDHICLQGTRLKQEYSKEMVLISRLLLNMHSHSVNEIYTAAHIEVCTFISIQENPFKLEQYP